MKYRISIYGYGFEIAIGAIDKETFEYIDDNFDCDVDDYFAAVEEGEVPEEFVICEDAFELVDNDTVEHEFGALLDCANVEVTDENDTKICDVEAKTLSSENIVVKAHLNDSEDAPKYLSVIRSDEKGGFHSAIVDIAEGSFDISKLKLITMQINYALDLGEDPIITGLVYDGEVLEIDDFGGTNGKGSAKYFIDVQRNRH